MANRPLITLTTDFGLNDHFVGTIKGVILDIVPEAEIVDVCHAVQAFDVLDGALTIDRPWADRISMLEELQASAGLEIVERIIKPNLADAEKFYAAAVAALTDGIYDRAGVKFELLVTP